jgi:hypothetical protein
VTIKAIAAVTEDDTIAAPHATTLRWQLWTAPLPTLLA